MKVLISTILIILSTQALATGTLFCESKDQDFVIEGTVARMEGSPLIGETYLKIQDQEINIERSQVVNYWIDEKEIKLLILDNEYNHTFLKLEVKKNIFGNFKGTAKVSSKTYKITCLGF